MSNGDSQYHKYEDGTIMLYEDGTRMLLERSGVTTKWVDQEEPTGLWVDQTPPEDKF